MFRGERSFRLSVLGFRVRDWAQGSGFLVPESRFYPFSKGMGCIVL